MPQEQKCQTQQECADQTFNEQEASAKEQMEMNKQIGGSGVSEIQCAAGSSASDCAQQQRTAETTMQASEDRRYEHCVGAAAGSQAGCGKKKRKRRRRRKSRRKSRKKSRKSRRKSRGKRRRVKRKTRRRRKSRK